MCWLCADAPGYLQQGQQANTAKNIAHFRQLLKKHGEMSADKASVAWWLAKQTQQVFSSPHWQHLPHLSMPERCK